ncbi:DUF1206 domain-containing protein [Marinomonas ostreistagni]|uniref:DUF1206 domain-containing protein n=1 Tax=Marinomonas ostreistagni TaxID=359209 RepID=UPI001950A961|nr:DUF1206 domain-containing protein [Marinomonas ostreistagni]MBM6551837.1 DUF1206 domain-containing protein [Marinomonas ostreistagni]
MVHFTAYKILARMGYAARGIIYLTIGALAFLSIMGFGDERPGSRGAILSLRSQPYGEGLLILLAAGLVGYVVWRLIQAINDSDEHGYSIKGLAIRAGLLISAVSHGALCYWILKLLWLTQEDSSSRSASSVLSDYVASEFQVVVFGGIGLIVIGIGVAHLIKGFQGGFKDYMEFPSTKRLWMVPICQFGLMARGVVWGIVGWIILRSAFEAGTSREQGIKQAFEWLSQAPYGNELVLVTAVGLFAFGAYSCLETLYRRVEK